MADLQTTAQNVIREAQEAGCDMIAFPFVVEKATGLIYQWQSLGDEGVLLRPASPDFQLVLSKLSWPIFEEYYEFFEGGTEELLEILADPDREAPLVVTRKRRR